jgi:hypothetical protein
LRRKKENLIAEGIMAHTTTGPNASLRFGAGAENGSASDNSGRELLDFYSFRAFLALYVQFF